MLKANEQQGISEDLNCTCLQHNLIHHRSHDGTETKFARQGAIFKLYN